MGRLEIRNLYLSHEHTVIRGRFYFELAMRISASGRGLQGVDVSVDAGIGPDKTWDY